MTCQEGFKKCEKEALKCYKRRASKTVFTLRELKTLQCVEYALTKQGKSSSAIAHPFNQLELVHMALDDSIVLDQSQSCHHRRFISLHPNNKPLQFANL